MPKKVTISDVAEAANVAVGTVSRVLNNHTDVNTDARQRVLEAASRLKYKRIRQRKSNNGGRSGEVRKTDNFGVIFFGMDDSLVHLPLISETLQGVEMATAAENRNLMLANIPKVDRIPIFLKNNQVEGLILKSPQFGDMPSPSENKLIKNILRFPLVWILGKPENAPGDVCSFDHEAAARLAAKHLYDKGHRRVAFLNPKDGQTSWERLKRNFRSACRGYGMELTIYRKGPSQKSPWPMPAINRPEEVSPLVEEWMETPKSKRPTAIFAPADSVAVQVYSVIESKGLEIGKDVSLISCNNEKPLVRGLKPSLTTLDVQSGKIGRRAVAQLLWRIEHPAEDDSVKMLIEPVLVEGNSVAAI